MPKSPFILLVFVFILSLVSCAEKPEPPSLQEGTWRGVIHLQDRELPFLFEVSKESEAYAVHLINGTEEFKMDNVQVTADSLVFSLHIFDIDIKAKINGNQLEGAYIKNYLDDYKLPFTAVFGKTERFPEAKSTIGFDGKWDLTFYAKNGTSSKGIGIFEKKEELLTGTILTPTGDYRYLEGTSTDSNFNLNTFDGNHAFIFEAVQKSKEQEINVAVHHIFNECEAGAVKTGKLGHEQGI